MRSPVAFIGTSNSGKTSLLVALVSAIASGGERVAVIKHTHHDPARRKPRGDTELYIDAGATQVVLAGRDQGALMDRSGSAEMRSFASASEIPDWVDADRVLVEGFKSLDLWPRILVERCELERVRPLPEVIAIVTDADERFAIPRFRHEDIAGLLAFLDRIAAE